MGTGATVALAVLVAGCVLAATAAPRVVLAARTQALQQTLAATTPLARTIISATEWSTITSDLDDDSFGAFGNASSTNLTAGQLGEVTSQLHSDFNRGVVKLAPASTDWMSMTTLLHTVTNTSALPGAGTFEVKFEVSYRQPFTQYTRLVAGHYPGGGASGTNGGASSSVSPVLQVAVSSQTARQFGLHLGSKVPITPPKIAFSGNLAGGITLEVTGIVAPRDASSTFWTDDPVVLTPDLTCVDCIPSIWIVGAFVGPGELTALQNDFGPEDMSLQWVFPLDVGSTGGQQAQPLYDALNKFSVQSPPLTGNIAAASSAMTVTAALLQPVGAFLGTAATVDTLLWLLYVSLAVAGVAALLLAGRMVAMRRAAELAVRRARGASLAQVAASVAGGAALACVPAAALGVLLGVLVTPGAEPAGGWWAPAGVLVIAVCAPALIAAWQQRLSRRAAGAAQGRGRVRRRGLVRVVAEVTVVAAALAGVLVFRQQGTQPGTSVNLYTSATPVLVAIPAVVVVLRVYPVVLRALLRGFARRPGAAVFLGLARAARTTLTPALPAFALVLALSLAAFAGMVRDAVTRGEVAASWQAAGADVSIAASTDNMLGDATISPAGQRAAAAVPGVTHAADVWEAPWTTPNGTQLTGLAVDPASYAALVAATQTYPQVQARLLAAGSPQPVLVSPQAAAELGSGTTTLTSQAAAAPVRVRVAGVLSGTPALPAGGAFVIMPLSVFRSTATPPQPVPINDVLLTGPGISTARVAAVLKDMIPGGVATFRSDILNGLTGAPLQHGAFVLYGLAIAAAAALGLAVMLFELALGAAEREATLARLATMGLGEGQRARVVALEVLPALLAAAFAVGACALVLPRVVAPALDLSVFTGSAGGVTLTPDVASFALPLAALVAVALAALYAEIRSGRRRGVAASMRTGG